MRFLNRPSGQPAPRRTPGRLRNLGLLLPAAAAMALFLLACSTEEVVTPETVPMEVSSLEVTSPAFAEGTEIPERFTCDGEDASPPLRWSGAPDGTRGYALIVDDADAPGGAFVHWVVYNISSNATGLAAGIPSAESAAAGGRQGVNGFGRAGYGGPCPPSGGPHRYFFRLFALDGQLDLQAGATRSDLLRAMNGHVVGQGSLTGTYQRR